MDVDPRFKPDCESCCGLCCVAPAFAASSEFALSKEAGHPCPHLTDGFRCSIHDRLRPEGFSGCVAYDCFGAGQKVTQITFRGSTWRSSKEVADQMFEVFGVMRRLHSMLMYLSEAIALPAAAPFRGELEATFAEVDELTSRDPEQLAGLDLKELDQRVDDLLDRTSELARSAV